MACSLDDPPESLELFQTDLSIVVDIDLREELIGRNSAERALPVLEGLVLINCIAAIDVENSEHFPHSLLAFSRQLLKILKKSRD